MNRPPKAGNRLETVEAVVIERHKSGEAMVRRCVVQEEEMDLS